MLKSTLHHILKFILEFLKISIRGWYDIVLDSGRMLAYFLRGVSLFQYLFGFACIAASGAAMAPWSYYEVDFLGREEVYIGSNYKIIFALPALVGITLLFIPTRKKRKIFYISYVFILIPYVIGYFFPNPIHTRMINPHDYTLLPVMHVYGGLLLLVGLFAYRALEKNVIDYSWLFTPLDLELKQVERGKESKKNLNIKITR